MTRSFLAASASVGAVLALAVALSSCGESSSAPAAEPIAPVVVIGVDGFEWSVIRDLMEDGGMPNVRALMERGSWGELQTIEPTLSPIIWNTIATGRTGRAHGITSFIDTSRDDPKTEELEGDVFTSTQRKVRAVWNIADQYGLSSKVVGWWTTWPIEEVKGVMVSGTSSSANVDVNWKPALDLEAPSQVWPDELEAPVMELAKRVGDLDVTTARATEIFGALKSEHFGLVEETVLIPETFWSVQSDETYFEISKMLFEDDGLADLNMVYFGGPDVSGHRFWRYYEPEAYSWPNNPEIDQWARSKLGLPDDAGTLADVLADERGNEILAGVIPRYYEWVDGMIGELVATVGDDATILLVADHGMRASATDRPNGEWITGHHVQGFDPVTRRPVGPPPPNGTILAAGPGIQKQVGIESFLRSGVTPSHGSVMNVTPTILALLGIPRSKEMESAYTVFMTPEAREKAVLPIVETHDDGFRAPYRVDVADGIGASAHQRLKDIGYVGENGSLNKEVLGEGIDGEGQESDDSDNR